MTYAKLLTLTAVLFCGRLLFAQSEKLVSMTAPNGRVYTTICVAERCEVHEAAYAADLVDPQYVHDRKQERRAFCNAKGLKHSACSLAFRREVSIQGLLRADQLISQAGNMRAMTRTQAEQLIDEINKR